MTLNLPRSKDFWAGMTFMLLAGLALWFSSDMSMGDAQRMGPRYFPALASGCLLVVGAIVALRGLTAAGAEPIEPSAVRPALVLVSVLLFGLLLRPLGYVVAVGAMIIVSSFAGEKSRLIEIAIVTVCLTFASWLIFVWALGLPLKTWWWS